MTQAKVPLVVLGASLGGVLAAWRAAQALPRAEGAVSAPVWLVAEQAWIGGQMTAQGVPPDEHPLIEHWPHLVDQPVVQFGAANSVTHGLDTEANFGERDGADEQVFKTLAGDEVAHTRIRARPAQLGNDVGVQQPAAHSLTARTGIALRAGSISMSR